MIKVDVLAIGAHPDDVELGCAGTILKEISLGKTVGIIDLTRGELGTRGSAEIRDQEANAAAKSLRQIRYTPRHRVYLRYIAHKTHGFFGETHPH